MEALGNSKLTLMVAIVGVASTTYLLYKNKIYTNTVQEDELKLKPKNKTIDYCRHSSICPLCCERDITSNRQQHNFFDCFEFNMRFKFLSSEPYLGNKLEMAEEAGFANSI